MRLTQFSFNISHRERTQDIHLVAYSTCCALETAHEHEKVLLVYENSERLTEILICAQFIAKSS